MGYSYCGKDSRGKDIGYGVSATCDFPGCATKIDRGMAYACGGSHGTEDSKGNPCCEGYFCEEHLYSHDCAAETDEEDTIPDSSSLHDKDIAETEC